MKAVALLLLIVGAALAFDFDDPSLAKPTPVDDRRGSSSDDDEPDIKPVPAEDPDAKPHSDKPTVPDELDDGAVRHSNIEGSKLDRVARQYLGISVNKVRDTLYPNDRVAPRLLNFEKPNTEAQVARLRRDQVLVYDAAPIAVHCDKKATLITSSVQAQEQMSLGGELSGIVQGSISGSHSAKFSADEHSSWMTSSCIITVARVIYQPGFAHFDVVDPFVDEDALNSLVECPARENLRAPMKCSGVLKWFDFFNKYGTHGVRAISLGGMLTVSAKIDNSDLNKETVSDINGKLQSALSNIIKNKEFKASVAKIGQEEPEKEEESAEDAAERKKLMEQNAALQKLLETGKDTIVDLLPLDIRVGLEGHRKSESSHTRKKGAVSYAFSVIGGNLKGGYPIVLHEESGSTGQYYPSVNREALGKWMESLTGENVQPVHWELGQPDIFFGGKLGQKLDELGQDHKNFMAAYSSAVKIYQSFYDTVATKKRIIAKGRHAMESIAAALENFVSAETISKGSIEAHGMPWLLSYRIHAAAVVNFCEVSCDTASDLARIGRLMFDVEADVKDTDREDCVRLCKNSQVNKIIDPTFSKFGIDTGGNPVVGSVVSAKDLGELSGWVQRVDRGFFKRDYKIHLNLRVMPPEDGSSDDIMDYTSILEKRYKKDNGKPDRVMNMNGKVIGVMFGLPENRPGFRIVTKDKIYSYQTTTPDIARKWCDALATHQVHYRVPAFQKGLDPVDAAEFDMYGHLFLPKLLQHEINKDGKTLCVDDARGFEFSSIPSITRSGSVSNSRALVDSAVDLGENDGDESVGAVETDDSGPSFVSALLGKDPLELAMLPRESSEDGIPPDHILQELRRGEDVSQTEFECRLANVVTARSPTALKVPSESIHANTPTSSKPKVVTEDVKPVEDVKGAEEEVPTDKVKTEGNKAAVVKEADKVEVSSGASIQMGAVNSADERTKESSPAKEVNKVDASAASGEVTAQIVSEVMKNKKTSTVEEHPVEEVKSLGGNLKSDNAPALTVPAKLKPATSTHASAAQARK